MRFSYLLYPEARSKLESAGLLGRIQKADDDHELQVRGFVDDSEIPQASLALKEEGYLDSLPEAERKEYGRKMNEAYKSYRTNSNTARWIVKRTSGEQAIAPEAEDILLLLGDEARIVLKKDEFFDYKRFGFDNVTAFVGSVGAAISEAKTGRFDDGYSWESKRPDGRTLATRVAGSEHMDLRIFQTDVTPYETIDLLGNKVPFRPQTEEDESNVSGYHSTEAELLASVFKYIHQTGAKPKFMEDNGQSLVAWARGLGQRGGGCAEHFGGFDRDARQFFIGHDIPLATLNDQYEPQGRCIDWVLTAGGAHDKGVYGIYVGPKKELVISYEEGEMKSDKRKAFSLMPEDMDEFVKGLLYQCAHGLGRTSVFQMIDVLNFRLSPDFKNRQSF